MAGKATGQAEAAVQHSATGSLLSARAEQVFTVMFVLLIAMWVYVLLRVPDRTFADDTYFYLQVAWNMARGMGSTFNTLMPTNGYHPLWMLLCTLVFKVIPERREATHGIAVLVAVFDGWMLLTVARVLRRVGAHLWPVAFLVLVPFCFGSQLGTEGALSGCFLALLMMTAWRFASAELVGANAAMFNSVAAIAVLSRLDNIFIVSFVWLAVWLLPGAGAGVRRRLVTVWAVIPLALWTGYVTSNLVLFHTFMPISGKLKSSGKLDHALGANLPHTALVALAIIIPCFAVVAARRRDLFFRVVELPFALGVLCHVLYIVFVMSSETRWTWYYTSWMLLGAVLMARTGAILLTERPREVVWAACGLALVVVAVGWWRISYTGFLKGRETRPPARFNAELYGRLGVRRAIAYDEPGVYAYFSDIEIVPIDGLMGDVAFQHELATKGIEEFVNRMGIQAWIGPSTPVDARQARNLCDQVFLGSEQFHCDPIGNGLSQLTAVDVYARMPPTMAGTLPLLDQNRIFTLPSAITVWRLQR